MDSKATLLKKSNQPKGLCINCAAHDILRNLYPANLILARSGPKGLSLPDIQKQFEAILKSARTDAIPGEINWDIVIQNWDLPFPNKIKRTAENPMNEDDLKRGVKFENKRRENIRLGKTNDDHRSVDEIFDDINKRTSEYFKQNIIPLLRDNDENS